MTAHIMFTAFNAHGSEHNLINQGRIEGETVKNNPIKKIITKKEESLHIRTMEKNAMNKRNVKVKLNKAPWE